MSVLYVCTTDCMQQARDARYNVVVDIKSSGVVTNTSIVPLAKLTLRWLLNRAEGTTNRLSFHTSNLLLYSSRNNRLSTQKSINHIPDTYKHTNIR